MQRLKQLAAFAQANQLVCDHKLGVIYGPYQGYFIAIQQDPSNKLTHTVTLCVKETGQPAAQTMSAFLNDCSVKYKHLGSVSGDSSRAVANWKCALVTQATDYAHQIEEFLQDLTRYCKSNGMVDCCENCGATENLSALLVGGKYHALCPNCQQQVSEAISQRKDEIKGKKGNLITGIVGALLGSLIGVAAWVGVYRLGYIAALVGLVLIVCTFKGFSLFGGKLNALGIVLCVAISAGMLYIAEQISVAWEILDVFGVDYGVTFAQAYRSIPQFMQDNDFKMAVIQDLAYGYLFMAAGGFSFVWQTYKKNNVAPKTQTLAAISPSSHTMNH